MSRSRLEPGPDHSITLERSTRRLTVSYAGHVVASTDRALVLREDGYDPVHYIPEADVEPGLLSPSDTTSYCPYKGEAAYVDLAPPAESAQSAEVVEDVAWTYREPYDAVAEIAGHVAFFADKVDIRAG